MIFPNEYQDDLDLTAEQLDDKYNSDGDGEHPLITREDWRTEVAAHGTINGYWEWLEYRMDKITINEDEDYELELYNHENH